MTPQICDGNSLWVNDPAQSGADCALACREGHCVDCNDDDTRCVNDRAQRCVGGNWDTGELCVNYCQAGRCINPPSCGVSDKCGTHGYSCCKSFYVPGGSFYLSYDEVRYTEQSFRARVDGFLLDKFEVTVERMRRFLEVYEPKVFKPGSGRAAHILDDTGWDALYPLPATAAELSVALKCSQTDATWAESANDTQATLPINCVDFFVAYAFCIWDGGRLPTEAEWNYAASGGEEQRVYPWSMPVTSEEVSEEHAAYGQVEGLPSLVGSHPKGDSRWLQSDLGGNVSEWTLDFYADPYPSTDCDNCVNTTAAPRKSLRGGDYLTDPYFLSAADRSNAQPNLRRGNIGFRCARDLKP